jgi:soluble lytic murein transglycosylase
MPPELGNQARWRYWRARATDELGDHEGAKALYAAVANERDYYSYLAADRLNLPYQLNFHPTADVPEMQRTLLATPAIQRARAFLDCGMEDEASVEWNYAMRDATPAQQVQAARLASRWQWYPQSITTLAKAGEWNDVRLRYPQPFAEPVAAAVNATGLPPVWIYGVMRQESLYRPDVRSPADALGLLQVLPSGAREIAHDAGLPVPTRAQLFEPATGVLFGALELREKFDGQNHQLARTFAAYNAGPTAVSRWLPPAPMASDIWAENIPYNETRGYVQRVLEHIVAFGWVTDGKPERISPWLGPILPRGSSAAAGAIPDATPSVAQPPATPAMTADPAAPAASTTPGNGQ